MNDPRKAAFEENKLEKKLSRLVGQAIGDFGMIEDGDKVMVCVLAEADMVETIREAIITAAHTGQVGDGLVWVIDIENIYRIRDRQTLN